MEFEHSLTNEKIKKDYDSQFDLVNHLIKHARDMIRSGREPDIDSDSDNIAVNIVEEILSGKTHFDKEEIIEKKVELEIDDQVPDTNETLEMINT